MFIRIKCNYSPIMLQHQIYNTSLKDYLESKATGMTMKNLNSTTLGDLQILYPPLSLQNQFAAIVEKVESVKTHYQYSLAELENLYGELSQKAFKGALDLSRVVLHHEKELAETISHFEKGLPDEIRAPLANLEALNEGATYESVELTDN